MPRGHPDDLRARVNRGSRRVATGSISPLERHPEALLTLVARQPDLTLWTKTVARGAKSGSVAVWRPKKVDQTRPRCRPGWRARDAPRLAPCPHSPEACTNYFRPAGYTRCNGNPL